jgi:hypothetical protein
LTNENIFDRLKVAFKDNIEELKRPLIDYVLSESSGNLWQTLLFSPKMNDLDKDDPEVAQQIRSGIMNNLVPNPKK